MIKNARSKETSLQQSVIQRINLLREHLSEDKSDEEYIHRIRVDIKYLRAWLRLTRLSSDAKSWKQMDKQLSEQSKHLGLVRDTQALRATITSLTKVTRSKKEKGLLQLLDEKFVEIPVSEINLAEISDNILSLLDIFQSDFVIVDSIDAINKKLNLSFNKARAAANIVFSKKDADEEIHRFRKWVKHIYYQLKYLGGTLSKEDKKELNKLGKELGEAHDLMVLKGVLPKIINADELLSLERLIDKQVKQILVSSKKRFKKLSGLSLEKLIVSSA